MRVTRTMAKILRLVIQHPSRRFHVLDLCREAGIPTGSAWPALSRLERTGWIASDWEDMPVPRRRLYWLTAAGQEAAPGALAEWDRGVFHRVNKILTGRG